MHRLRAARALRLPVLVALLSLCAGVAHAQPFETLGTRALGMGGAFVAVADDASAAYWNPAGLVTGHFLSLLADRSQFEQARDPNLPGAAAAEGSGTITALSTNEVAFAHYSVRVEQTRTEPDGAVAAKSLRLQHLAVSGAQTVFPGVSVGTTLRYVRGQTASLRGAPGSPVDGLLQAPGAARARGRGAFDLDVGLMLGTETVRVGLVARNLRQPSFETLDGGAFDLDRHVRAGVSVRTVAGLLVSADVDLHSRIDANDGQRRNVALGAEHWFGQWLGVRGGVRANLEAEDPRMIRAVGISFAVASGVYLDGQITTSRNSAERGWGIAARFGF